MRKQCESKTAKGIRCTMPALKGSRFCFTHSPDTRAQRTAARKLGGFHRRTAARLSGDQPPTIASMADVLKLINVTLMDVWALENSPARGRVLLSCAEVAIKALEMTDLEMRVSALEAARSAGGTGWA